MNEVVYGKLVNGELKIHGVNFLIQNKDGTVTLTSDVGLLVAAGFKKVVYTEPIPPEGYEASDYTWDENDDAITQVWQYTEIATDITPTLEEQVAALQEQNDMLTMCILEMSEIIYA